MTERERVAAGFARVVGGDLTDIDRLREVFNAWRFREHPYRKALEPYFPQLAADADMIDSILSQQA